MLDKIITKLREKGSVVFPVKVIPRSKKTEISGTMSDGTMKIRLKAVPEEGKANQELVSFLSKELNIPISCITIKSGKTSSRKLIYVAL